MPRTFVLTALILAAGMSAGGQQPPPQPRDPQMPPITFRSEINYVEVDAVVVDSDGNFVRNLRKEDFQVSEDGRPQPVTAFALVDIPIERDERPLFIPKPVEPDVQSNTGRPEGRLYMLVLDDLHTYPLRSARVRAAAKQFVDRNLGANDLAAVIHTSGRSDAAQDFTNNRRRLDEAIDKFMGRKLRSATLEKVDQYDFTRDTRQSGQAVADPLEQERAYNARSMLNTIRNISDWLAGVHGRRKALVFISEGVDYDIGDIINNREASTIIDETRDAIGAATRGNVVIYAVDPRGLTDGGEDGIEMAGPTPDDQTTGISPTSMLDELRRSQDSLRTFAEETGGFAAVNANDYRRAFSRIVTENSSYYVLGYYATNAKRDGKYRRIEVRLTRPGLEVRARKGYVAPRGKAPSPKDVEASAGTSAALRDALNSPIQITGIPMSVFAAPFKGTAPNASVLLVTQVGGADLPFTQRDGKFTNTLEVSYLLIDAQGKVKAGSRESVNMTLKPDTYERVQRAGFRVQMRAAVPPGRYQLRVAARETNGGRTGAVYYDLDVPDFLKEPLVMSGLTLTSASAGQVPTAGSDSSLKDMLPGPPTTRREFQSGDELALLVEVYDNVGPQSHKVYVSTTLRGDDGHGVFSNSEERSSSELGGGRGGYGYTVRIPLKDVQPGVYILKVEARSSLGKEASASREVVLRIVP